MGSVVVGFFSRFYIFRTSFGRQASLQYSLKVYTLHKKLYFLYYIFKLFLNRIYIIFLELR